MLYPQLCLKKVEEQVCFTNELLLLQVRQVVAMASLVCLWCSGQIELRLVWDLGLSWEAAVWYLVKVALLVFFNRAVWLTLSIRLHIRLQEILSGMFSTSGIGTGSFCN